MSQTKKNIYPVLFSVFDYDGNSRIDRNDLRACLRKMVQDQLTQEELATVVEKVFEEVDPQRTGSITYEAFAKVNPIYIYMIDSQNF